MDETVAQAKAWRIGRADDQPKTAAEAVQMVIGPQYTDEGRRELMALGVDPDAVRYVGVTSFFARPVFLVRDLQGNLNDHTDFPGRKPSLWEVEAVAKFSDGDTGTVGIMYCATKKQAEAVAKKFNAELRR